MQVADLSLNVVSSRGFFFMLQRLRSTPDGSTVLEVETALRRHDFVLPSGMSPAARLAFLASPRLASILGRLTEAGGEDAEGYVLFALHKLALDLSLSSQAQRPPRSFSPALEPPSVPVARIAVRQCGPSEFVLCTSYKDSSTCRKERLASLQQALTLALPDLPPEATAVELTYEGIVSGTYPRSLLERNAEQVANQALHTKGALEETLGFANSPLGSFPVESFQDSANA